MRLIKCDICGKEITESYQTVTDFNQLYEVCKKCEKKFNSYKKEKQELYSSIKKEFDIKFNKKEKELQEKYGIKFIENTTENHKNYF